MSGLDFQKVYARLNPSDWDLLENIVLDASRGVLSLEAPEHLRSHEAAICLEEFTRTRGRESLNRAVRALALCTQRRHGSLWRRADAQQVREVRALRAPDSQKRGSFARGLCTALAIQRKRS